MRTGDSPFLEKDVYDYFGWEVAGRVLIDDVVPSTDYYKDYNYSKDRLWDFYRLYGVGEEFWVAMDIGE